MGLFGGSAVKHRFQKGVIGGAALADFEGLMPFLNTSNWSITSEGAQCTDVSTGAALLATFGAGSKFRHWRATADMKFLAATAQGSEDLALVCNWASNQTGSPRDYIMARLNAGNFRISQIKDGSATTKGTAQAKVVAQGTLFKVEFWRDLTVVKARIDGGTWIEGTVLEADVPYAGSFGFRSGFGAASTVCVRAFDLECW